MNFMNASNQLLFIAFLVSIIVCQCVSYKSDCISLGNRASNDLSASRMSYTKNNSFIKLSPVLGLHMIIVALESGSSLPFAIEAVGSVFESNGEWMRAVAFALKKGSTWEESWSSTYVLQNNVCRDRSNFSVCRILGFTMLVRESGSSLPFAIEAVGSVFESNGEWMRAVAFALKKGSTWEESWSSTYVLQNNVCRDRSNFSVCRILGFTMLVRNKSLSYKNTDYPLLAKWLSKSLRESWYNGIPSLPILKAVLKNYGYTMQNAAKQEAAKLSVRLLLPVGLCFLPAFICIGILPTVASFIQ